LKKKKLGYQEGFQDYLARFGCGVIIGVLFAFAAITRYGIQQKNEIALIIIGCGIFAAIAWNPFWRLIEYIAKIFSWPLR
jgi:hypothetical protein